MTGGIPGPAGRIARPGTLNCGAFLGTVSQPDRAGGTGQTLSITALISGTPVPMGAC
jgi:hypothetical protein